MGRQIRATENRMKNMNLKSIYFIILFTICISCKNDNSEQKKQLQTEKKSNNELLTQCLPQIIDNAKLEKEKIVIYSEKENETLILSKNELSKIEKLFPLFKSDFFLNPHEAYSASGEWKDYINQNGKKEHYSFGSEAGQDKFCLIYTYYLKQKNGEQKFKTERQNLIKLYKAINELYGELNYGGTFYGHQNKRLNAFAEYSVYLLKIKGEYYNKKYDFRNQKKIYLKSLIQYVTDEESQNVYNQIDLVENKTKAIERAKELEKKIDILQKLITNYFYLNQVQNFENNYK
ncbi:hypothetical protein FB1_28440 [Flavobacterium branchiophilum NBRC 15030 = ATCC 35035]|uniref:Uncharacterized protein n=2 Tax=Flavobacterium branchiophilum TaxID=55197 RepID=A0A543G6C0_9FLAO|nr:hypothetical protein BC670_2629 [Flavobacterium branchiophilum]GEM56623.1 hypothetical protein FB1_28440 [Flavobacterium branchiophilum NBRC 15030 = ATCC 35035]